MGNVPFTHFMAYDLLRLWDAFIIQDVLGQVVCNVLEILRKQGKSYKAITKEKGEK